MSGGEGVSSTPYKRTQNTSTPCVLITLCSFYYQVLCHCCCCSSSLLRIIFKKKTEEDKGVRKGGT